jgi:hypothetical protein
MKKFYYSHYHTIFILYIIFGMKVQSFDTKNVEHARVSFSSFSKKDVDAAKLQKDKNKLEKNLKKVKHELEDLKNSTKIITVENDMLKFELRNKTEALKIMNLQMIKLKEDATNYGSSDNIIREIKTVLKGMSQFNGLLHQVEMNNLEEKHLKIEFSDKMKEISDSQKHFNDIYLDINQNYKEKLKSISSQIHEIEVKNKEIKDKLMTLEVERDKTSKSRKLKSEGIKKSPQIIEPKCINRNSCRTCLEDSECVWCSKLKKCVLGDMSGAYDGKCNGRNEFNYSKCDNENFCGKFETCTECLVNVNCGWCAVTNLCVEGTERSPLGDNYSCPISNYFHKMKQGRCSSHSNFKSSIK